jgi:putative membrane protein
MVRVELNYLIGLYNTLILMSISYPKIEEYHITMTTITQWIVSALAIGITAFVLPGASATVVGALLAAIVLGLVNAVIKPLLVILTLPINILTLGLFTFIINGILILIASGIVPGFKVNGLLTAIVFSIILTIVNIILFKIIK